MSRASAPSFRWSVLAFVLVTAAVVVLATALLVLLDPRSQAWWGGLFSGLGSSAHAFLRLFFR